ncbi:Sec20-domain-containing protein [Mycena amicta]|nr:Sec20-domain-containing protein [Mycena amicta]
MPPIPSTLPEPTLALIASAQRRIDDISTHQLPRLRECTGPRSTLDALDEELRSDLNTVRSMVEQLDGLVGDLTRKRDLEELEGVVGELGEKLLSLKREARDALLAAKRRIDAYDDKARRDELLGGSEKRGLDDNEKTGDAVMAAQDQVTGAMQRTMALLQAELERSVLSSQMLSSSTTTLRSTSSTHDTLTSVMDTSKQLITALEKADWLDRILIFAALGFFVLVVLFVLKQRIFDRSMRLAFWWTRFLPDFSGDEELLAAGEKGMGSKVLETVASSVVSASTALATSLEPSISATISETLSSVVSEASSVHNEL